MEQEMQHAAEEEKDEDSQEEEDDESDEDEDSPEAEVPQEPKFGGSNPGIKLKPVTLKAPPMFGG